MRYGLPYQGSKNKLAQWIVNLLPSAEYLYDVFAGGCAVSHCALLSGKWNCVHFSDINDSVVLFRDCLEGNVPDGSEWISREEFLRRRDTDPYVRLVWSFGNNQRDYLYSRDIEPYKKAVHEMIFAPTPTERRLKFREVCKLMPLISRGGYLEHAQRQERLCIGFNRQRRLPPPTNRCGNATTSQSTTNRSNREMLFRCEPQERWGGGWNSIDCNRKSVDMPLKRPFVVGSMR